MTTYPGPLAANPPHGPVSKDQFLNRLLSQQGTDLMLGLGGVLSAAGSASTDPGHAGRMMAHLPGVIAGVNNRQLQRVLAEQEEQRRQKQGQMAHERHGALMAEVNRKRVLREQQQSAMDQLSPTLSEAEKLYMRLSPATFVQSRMTPQKTPGGLPEIDALTARLNVMDPNDPNRKFYEQRLQKLTQPGSGVIVNTGPKLSPFQTAVEKARAGRYLEVGERATGAAKQLQDISIMEDMLDRGLQTGFGQNWLNSARSLGRQLGVDVDVSQIAGAELFEALSNKMVLPMAKSLGANPSNRDAQLIAATFPQLTKTPEGNKLLLKAIRRQAELDIELAQMADQHIQENGDYAGFDLVAARYMASQPLLDPQDKQVLAQLTGAQGLPRYQAPKGSGGTFKPGAGGVLDWVPNGVTPQNSRTVPKVLNRLGTL